VYNEKRKKEGNCTFLIGNEVAKLDVRLKTYGEVISKKTNCI